MTTFVQFVKKQNPYLLSVRKYTKYKNKKQIEENSICFNVYKILFTYLLLY